MHRSVCACFPPLLDSLKPESEYAQILRAIDLGNGSVADFASAAGIARNNAAVPLDRARDALELCLRAACGTCADHGCQDWRCRPMRYGTRKSV